VYSIDFFNMNSQFYQLQENKPDNVDDLVERIIADENGFIGNTQYPESAKLNTIAMGKVAYDVFELKRLKREYKKEQFKKNLNIIKKEDDYSEIMVKLFEQVRIINNGLEHHLTM